MGPIQSLSELISVLRRRLTVWATIIVIGCFVTLIYIFSQPKIYETTAVIQIGNSQISNKITGNNTNASSTQRLQKLEQRIMARDKLITLIDKHNLFGLDPTLSMGDKVYQLRLATEIQQIIDPTQAWRPDASPSALTVTVRLGDPELVAIVAQDFVNDIITQNSQTRLEQARKTFTFFESEKKRVGNAISDLDTEIALFKELNADALPSAIPTQLALLVSLEDAALDMQQQIVEMKSGKSKNRISGFEQQLTLIEKQASKLSERISRIKSAIATAPQVEKEFNILTRRLAQLESQYAAITQNRANAEIEQMLESGVQSNSLTILENPLVPEWPVSPKRKKLAVIGLFLSAIIAAVVCLIMELLNPAIRNAAQLERQLQITAVVSIPLIKPVKKRGWKRSMFTFGTAACSLSIWVVLKFVGQHTG